MKTLKIFVITSIITFIFLMILDIPQVKHYIKKESDRARIEMFKVKCRYNRAVMGQ